MTVVWEDIFLKPNQGISLPEGWGLDPKYWNRNYSFLDHTKTKKLKKWEEGAWSVCGRCVSVSNSNKLKCCCVYHVPCGNWFSERPQPRCDLKNHCCFCCRCVICPVCNSNLSKGRPKDFVKPLCNECASCLRCCTCTMCEVCDRNYNKNKRCEFCQAKSHHSDCCEHDDYLSRSGIHFIHRAPVFMPGNDFQENRCRRLLSIETEIQDYNRMDSNSIKQLNLLLKKWRANVVEEGSCPHGFEVGTAPASGNVFLKMINELVPAYMKIEPNVGVRCGMHVHVDARDYTYMDIANFLYLYAAVEPALYAMLPPWRRVNRFAVPCRNTLLKIAKSGGAISSILKNEEWLQQYVKLKPNKMEERVLKPAMGLVLANKLYGKSTLKQVKKSHKNHDNQHVRYMAVNLHSWVYQRTIEFRHWPGSLNINEMTLWPQICGTLLEFAKRTPIKVIQCLSNDPVQALFEVLKPRSWISPKLLEFAKSKIEQWSPDWQEVWRIIQHESSAVTPFCLQDINGWRLCFDIGNKAYTYIHPEYVNWEFQWESPARVGPTYGRYATINDLQYAAKTIPAWIAPLGLQIKPERPNPTQSSIRRFDIDPNVSEPDPEEDLAQEEEEEEPF